MGPLLFYFTLTSKKKLPPHMGPPLFYFTLTRESKVIPHLAKLPQQFISGAGGVRSTDLQLFIFLTVLHHGAFGQCVGPPVFKLFVTLDFVPCSTF